MPDNKRPYPMNYEINVTVSCTRYLPALSTMIALLAALVFPVPALAETDNGGWVQRAADRGQTSVHKKSDRLKRPLSRPKGSGSSVRKKDGPNLAWEAFDQGRYLTALKEAKIAADRGEAEAHTLIGRIYSEGHGVPQNHQVASEWFLKAAELGDPLGSLQAALLLAEGKGIKRDFKLAAKLFEASAKKGNLLAQYNLALLIADGRGRKTDFGQAAKWLNLAAKNGHAPAQYDLGVLYAVGKGVPKDERKAAEWIGQAATQGLPSAEVEYAVLLFKGRGIKRDQKRAYEFFRSSAHKGNPVAQNRLARLYAYGVVVEKNPIEAAKWHLISREKGLSDGRMDMFLARMNNQQMKTARDAASSWKKANAPR